MRLTDFTDFGMRVLMRLAGEPARGFTVEAIAEEFGLSRDHLAKIVRRLAVSGFVKTQRGAGGGLGLARDPAAIRLGEVVRALEASYPMVECFKPGGGHCRLSPGCRLKVRFARAQDAFLSDLNASTLADIAWTPPVARREVKRLA